MNLNTRQFHEKLLFTSRVAFYIHKFIAADYLKQFKRICPGNMHALPRYVLQMDFQENRVADNKTAHMCAT